MKKLIGSIAIVLIGLSTLLTSCSNNLSDSDERAAEGTESKSLSLFNKETNIKTGYVYNAFPLTPDRDSKIVVPVITQYENIENIIIAYQHGLKFANRTYATYEDMIADTVSLQPGTWGAVLTATYVQRLPNGETCNTVPLVATSKVTVESDKLARMEYDVTFSSSDLVETLYYTDPDDTSRNRYDSTPIGNLDLKIELPKGTKAIKVVANHNNEETITSGNDQKTSAAGFEYTYLRGIGYMDKIITIDEISEKYADKVVDIIQAEVDADGTVKNTPKTVYGYEEDDDSITLRSIGRVTYDGNKLNGDWDKDGAIAYVDAYRMIVKAYADADGDNEIASGEVSFAVVKGETTVVHFTCD